MRTLFWLGLGAAAMYLLDPEQGRRRRAQAREKVIQARHALRERAMSPSSETRTPESTHHLGR
ncbi:MAG: hypothetical protein ACREUN_11230 [Burkholderiales bacterium]